MRPWRVLGQLSSASTVGLQNSTAWLGRMEEGGGRVLGRDPEPPGGWSSEVVVCAFGVNTLRAGDLVVLEVVVVVVVVEAVDTVVGLVVVLVVVVSMNTWTEEDDSVEEEAVERKYLDLESVEGAGELARSE